MTKNYQKKVVLLKSIDSNIVEEAILILRDENYIYNVSDEDVKEKRNFMIMREAYSLIDKFEEDKKDIFDEITCEEYKPTFFQKIKDKIFTPMGIIVLAMIGYLIYRIVDVQ